MRIDPTVKRTTAYIAACELTLSALMEAVFLVLRAWNVTVLWGNLLGAGVAVLNFFLMGLSVQRAVRLSEEDAKKLLRASQSLRLLMLLALCAVGAALPAFDLIAMLIPLFFPRVGMTLWPRVEKRWGLGDGTGGASPDEEKLP